MKKYLKSGAFVFDAAMALLFLFCVSVETAALADTINLPSGAVIMRMTTTDPVSAYNAKVDAYGNIYEAQGVTSFLNITAATTVKASPGRMTRIAVTVAGSSAGTVNDSASTGGATAANAFFSIPFAATGAYLIDWPCSAGITIVPGTGQTVSVTYQ